MQIFLSFCIPWPQGSTCPPAVHCWQLDFSGPWWTVVGTMSLKTLPRSPLPCVTLGEGLRVSGRKVGLVDRNRCFCVFGVGAVGSRGHMAAGRASLQTGGSPWEKAGSSRI